VVCRPIFLALGGLIALGEAEEPLAGTFNELMILF